MNYSQPLPLFGDQYDGNKMRQMVRILQTDPPDLSNKAVQNISAAYQVQGNVQLVLANATGGAFAVTLPDATDNLNYNRTITIKRINSGTNAVTINTSLSQTIDGAATQSLAAQWSTLQVTSNGTAWFITAKV
jgi:hypothetical protein